MTDASRKPRLQATLVEEMVLNPAALPEGMQDYRMFRVEYGFEGTWEGRLLLPPEADRDAVERAINGK